MMRSSDGYSIRYFPLVDVGLVIFVVALSLLARAICVRLFLSPLAAIPGPKLAALHDIFGFRFTELPHEALCELHRLYGAVVRVAPNEVTVASSEHMPAIYGLKAALPKAPVYDIFRNPRVEGPMFAMRDNSPHDARRKLLNPAYSRTSIMTIEPWLLERTHRFCELLEKTALRAEPIDVLEYFRLVVGDTALKIAFNIDSNMVEHGGLHPMMTHIKTEMGIPFHIYKLRPMLPYLPFWLKACLPSKLEAQLLSLSAIDNLSELYLLDYLKTCEPGGVSQGKEVLSRIVNAHDPVSKERLSVPELTAEARSVLVAGTDTVATTLTYAVWLIFQSPTRLATLRAELATVMGDIRSLPPYLSILESLPFLTACVYEVMRLYPAIPGPLPRLVPQDGMQIGSYWLPAGTIVGASVLSLHRSQPELWGESPEQFRPERWATSKERVSTMRKSLMTFSMGPRSCIGRVVAQMQLYIVLAAFLARFNGEVVSSAEDMRPEGTFNLAPRSGECLIRLTALT